jgi:CHAT domain-containing protein/tetratricopeptide (TPR) repeat protein
MPLRRELLEKISLRQTYRKLTLVFLALLTVLSTLTLPSVRVRGEEAPLTHLFHISQADQPLRLSMQGKKLYEAGQFNQALEAWQQAEKAYARVKDHNGVTQSRINQAQAIQAQGHYSQACNTLLRTFNFTTTDCQQLVQLDESDQHQQTFFLKALSRQPNSLNKTTGLRSLGDVFLRLDALELSREVLQLSMKTAQAVASPEDESAALLSLGNALAARGNRARARQEIQSIPQSTPWRCLYRPSLGAPKEFYQQAANFYAQAASGKVSALTKVQAQINHLNALLESNALSEVKNLWQPLLKQIQKLPVSRTTVNAQLNLAQSLTCLKQAKADTSSTQIAEILATTAKRARSLGDKRAESYALGYLAGLYAQNQQWSDAQRLTSLALALAVDAADIAYQWQWQLAFILKALGDTPRAIATYTEAVNTLQSLRSDLSATSRDVQFSFSERVEPVYRQLVDLLLQPNQTQPKNLEQARDAIEALQIAELENLLRCNLRLASSSAPVERLADPAAAIIYPIILDNRIEILLGLYEQPLRHYSISLPNELAIADRIETWRQKLQTPNNIGSDTVKESQQLYDWLLRPVAAELELNHVQTLVFVLNGSMRNIPIAALHDGQQYLIEKYALVVSPSLQLLQPKLVKGAKLEVLAAGISQKIPNFDAPALPEVSEELAQIKQLTNSVVLRNQQFTLHTLENRINKQPFSVVHLATHGQFSSDPNQTYIRAWDERIDVNQLKNLLQTRETSRPEVIDLLVLSACNTASGDKQAALGLAGVAVRAGARSTLASLWQVGDDSTAELMTKFYQELSSSAAPITKAQALQSAQLELLHKYKDPFYWTPYVLVGNWF